MKKNTDVVSGLVSEEHPFYQAQTQPGKAKQHRYERRKIRNILKVGDWGEEIEYEEASCPGEKRLFRTIAAESIGEELVDVFVGRVELAHEAVGDFHFGFSQGEHGGAEHGWQPGLAKHHLVFAADGRLE